MNRIEQETAHGTIRIETDSESVSIIIPGYGTNTMPVGQDDAVIYIEFSDHIVYPRILVWGNINKEDWTDEITIGPAARHESLILEDEDE